MINQTMTTDAGEIKRIVREKYAEIALQEPACCSSKKQSCFCCGNGVSNYWMADDYQNVTGYNAEADLGLGCGLPTTFAQIKTGDTVLDLGSGAGNDCFVALSATGPTGEVIGVDFTPSMVERARNNAQRCGYNNDHHHVVKFLHGDIEDLPIPDATVDVVISNCVLNLVPHKATVFCEIMRVLRPGGHFSISDIVLEGPPLPEKIRLAATMYAGCVSGALLPMEDYLALIRKAGFMNMVVQTKKPIAPPKEILLQYLSKEEMNKLYSTSGAGIFSITVYAEKAAIHCAKCGTYHPHSTEDCCHCC
jgi:arsenite methyltransferase